ncbi:MAG TPA: hypothetical protein VLZ81_04445 [Blastocatellia bacterium]|nr:hypothetical protein [Blastocatellia bacterium]
MSPSSQIRASRPRSNKVTQRDADNSQPQAQHIWDEIAAISADLPDEAWADVPVDGADQHDHYLYGTPKRDL